jgi:hypothetical protein
MRRVVLVSAFLGLSGCSTLFPPFVPDLQPGFRREKASIGSSSCSPNHCRHNIKVGSQKFRVETRTRVVSSRELSGANTAERAAAGLLGWGLRRAGLTTIDDQIVVGSRTVTSEGSPWRLDCSVAWIDQRERSRDETEHRRITEGIECEQRAADSSVVQGKWKFRYGVAPSVDSMAAITDTLGIGGSGASPIAPVLLAEGKPVVMYRLTEEPFGTILGVPRGGGWRVERPDSTTVGALRVPPVFACFGHCVLDFRSATPEEENALRFVAAALTVPLQR